MVNVEVCKTSYESSNLSLALSKNFFDFIDSLGLAWQIPVGILRQVWCSFFRKTPAFVWFLPLVVGTGAFQFIWPGSALRPLEEIGFNFFVSPPPATPGAGRCPWGDFVPSGIWCLIGISSGSCLGPLARASPPGKAGGRGSAYHRAGPNLVRTSTTHLAYTYYNHQSI